jgi:hypothetical protein
MNVFNVEPAEVDINIIAGNTIDIDFNVTLPEGDAPLTDCQLDMHIRKADGSLFRALSSIGDDPGLIAVSTGFSIVTDPITEVVTFWYDIVKTYQETKKTFIKGKVIISKRQTEV